MARPCHVLRVFTRGDVGGNHLGVINDVVGVSDLQMQAIAADLGFSETIFVDWTAAGRPPAIRIFTPESELPFAGHPLVGCAWTLAHLGPGIGDTILTPVGPVAYSISGDVVSVDVDIPIEVIDPDDVASTAVDAGMPLPTSTARLAIPKEYLIAEFADFDTVASLDPDMEALAGRFGFLAYSRDGARVKARFFVPSEGIPEDPATGSAAVALAHRFKLRGEPAGSVEISQGEEVGHPSTIHLAWSDGPTRIGGSVRRDEVRLVP